MSSCSVTAIVVNYNAADRLAACIASLAANELSQVIVVDNDSRDGSERVARAAGVRWVPTGANLGYGRAANRGAAQPEGRAASFLLVCNPDLEVGEGAVKAMMASLRADPSLGVVGPRLLNEDGTLYPSARTFPDMVDAIGHGLFGMIIPGNRFTRRYRLLDWDHGQPARVDWISGACFLARREAWDAVGGFDPAYFMYMEDVDLCWRLGRAGWKVGYEPAAEVMHVQGVSTDRRPYRMLAAHHHSMWRFAWRTTTGVKRAALPMVGAGLLMRLAVAAAEHRFGRSGPPRMPATTGTRAQVGSSDQAGSTAPRRSVTDPPGGTGAGTQPPVPEVPAG